MTPTEYYQEQCQKGFITADTEQLMVLSHMERVFQEIIHAHKKRHGAFAFLRRPVLVKGLYLWGGVGIGKTFLMDCFFQCLPFKQKMRMHFHQFMQLVHTQLKKHQGEKDPLQNIAKEIAEQTEILCFDELFVSDITDAMLLGRLFRALFSRGVSLVTTSNAAPDELYKNGLQREQFLPAIDMIKLNTDVVHIPTVIDYRLRHLKEAGVFYSPIDDVARENMEKTFNMLKGDHVVSTKPIRVFEREIKIKKQAGDIIWFHFSELCSVPRSQHDYLLIAEKYRTVFVSDIPAINPNAKDTICLFISMVDVFYDARVRLVISAAEPVSQLYSKGYMLLEFMRTNSRLLEMQSLDYFLG